MRVYVLWPNGTIDRIVRWDRIILDTLRNFFTLVIDQGNSQISTSVGLPRVRGLLCTFYGLEGGGVYVYGGLFFAAGFPCLVEKGMIQLNVVYYLWQLCVACENKFHRKI